jgi:predicted phage terminase large subunit-like protein
MLLAKVSAYRKRWGTQVIFLVEAAGAGVSLISTLRKVGASCFHYYPRDGKEVRAAYVLPVIHSGRVFIVDRGEKDSWVEPYLNEFASFPHGRFDDQVDSLVQLINWGERRFFPSIRMTIT